MSIRCLLFQGPSTHIHFIFIFISTFYFFKVLLHTYIDSLRIDESREINHHGKTRKVRCYKLSKSGCSIVIYFYDQNQVNSRKGEKDILKKRKEVYSPLQVGDGHEGDSVKENLQASVYCVWLMIVNIESCMLIMFL